MKELVIIEKQNVMGVFTNRELLTPLLEKIKIAAMIETFDASSDKGRKAIASMAYRVAQSKTYIESHGKELVAELKELPKLIDSNRKFAKDFLDNLRDTVRKPLTEWEAEKEAIKLKEQIEIDHCLALIENMEWILKKKESDDRIARERAEYEARVLEQAHDAARKQIIEAEARALSAEHDAIRAKEKAENDIKKAQIKIDQERLIEQRRISDEDHITRVNDQIINDLLAIGLNDKQALFIFEAVKNNKIGSMKIIY